MSLAILFHFLCAQHVSDINKLVFYSSTRTDVTCWLLQHEFFSTILWPGPHFRGNKLEFDKISSKVLRTLLRIL